MNEGNYYCPFLPADKPENIVGSQRKCPAKHKDVGWRCPLEVRGECAIKKIAERPYEGR